MTLEEIDAALAEEMPDNFILQSWDVLSQRLEIAFTCDGGPREDQAYRVRFEKAVIFHVPAFLFQPVRLRRADEQERQELIPAENYDPLEYRGARPSAAILLTDPSGRAIGYYIVARSWSAQWVPWQACLETL